MTMRLKSLSFFFSALLFTGLAKAQDSTQSEMPLTALFTRQTVTGEWFGGRPFFEEHGVSFFGSYTCEVWGNTAGGLRTGSVYTGLLDFGAV